MNGQSDRMYGKLTSVSLDMSHAMTDRKARRFMKNIVQKNPYPVGIAIAALVVASPLIWRQVPNPSFIIYPVVLIGISWLVGIAAARLANLDPKKALPLSQLIFFLVSCVGLGFATLWMATVPLEVAGNLWRGSVLVSNLLFGLMCLFAGGTAIFAIRTLRSAQSTEHTLIVGGVALVLTIIMWSGELYKVPSFDIFKHIGSSGVRSKYILYYVFEAIFWRLVFPVGMAAGILVHMLKVRT